MSQPLDRRPSIMIVDDTPANLLILQALLSKQGYRVQGFPRGQLAIDSAELDPPDLILLDVAMPEMDGYEVCTRLKSMPKLAEIPVIFLSAMQETVDKVMAFGCGGVDYITKPFEIEEVQARVETHLALCRQRRELKENLELLKKSEEMRENLSHLIVHDMRSPLSIVRMSIELLQMTATNLDERERGLVDKAWRGTETLMELINQILDINRLESGQMPLNKVPCNLSKILQSTLDRMAPLFSDLNVQLPPQEPLTVMGDEKVLNRVLENLIGNALKFTPSGGDITLAMTHNETEVRVTVGDNGPGIPPEYLERIFQKFVQIESEHTSKGTGLGLTFCKLAVEAHGGQIGVQSTVGAGSAFWFTLPLCAEH